VLELLLLLAIFIVVVVAVYLYARSRTVAEAKRLFEEWRSREAQLIEERARNMAVSMLEEWKQKELKSVEEMLRNQFEAQAQALASELAKKMFEEWRATELENAKKALEESIKRDYEAKFQQWVQESEKRIREDAVQRSLNTILGRVGEELAPLIIFTNYGIAPKDLRHIGSPVDYVAFRGYSSEKKEVDEIVFIEVKTGRSSALSDVERSVRRAVESGRVRFVVINVREELERLQASIVQQARATAQEQPLLQQAVSMPQHSSSEQRSPTPT